MKIHALVPQLSVIFIFVEAVNVLLTTVKSCNHFFLFINWVDCLVGVRSVSNLTSFTEDIDPPCLKSRGQHRRHACICWMAKRKKHPRSQRGQPLISATCTSDGHQFNFLLLFLRMGTNFALPFIQFASSDLVEILVVETSSSISREQSIIFPYISIWSHRVLYCNTNN